MAFPFDFGVSCIVLLVVIIVIALIFIFVLEFVIEFLPSVLIAGLVYWFSGGNVIYTIVAFLVSAVFFAIIGSTRRRRRD
jgi:hypothetical protein